MEPIFELAIDLPKRGTRDLLRSLHAQLRAAIIDGRLKSGLRLPPTRIMAATFGVSRNTAVAAYDLLLSEGYLVARRGAGTYVAASLPQVRDRKVATTHSATDRRLNATWRKPPVVMPVLSRRAVNTDFLLGIPDKAHFPFDVWRRLAGRAIRAVSKGPAESVDPQGNRVLREAIARHVSFARAVACRSEDVVVTAGAQQAFDLLFRILVTPERSVVAIENPGYPRLRAALVAASARIVAVPVDAEGLVVERIPRAARVICVTPSHQFPLGTAMSIGRRAALLEFAAANGAVVIEDDYDGEFRFSGRPLDALQTLDRAESVLYVGTFSKSLFWGLRMGFAVVPPWAREPLVAVKQTADWQCDLLTQETLAAFIAEGHLARHVRKMRAIYAKRREALLGALHESFEPWLEPIPSLAGLHLAAFTKALGDADAAMEWARANDVGIYSLRPFYLGKPSRPGLVFGYGALEERAIKEGMLRLRRFWRR